MNDSQSNSRPEKLSGLILAGGRGSRFGGDDKGLVVHDGKPMVASVAAALARDTDQLIISANRNHARYQPFGDTIVSDAIGDHWGPLAGIYTGLIHSNNDWLVVATCDQPRLPPDYVSRLTNFFDGQSIIMATDCQRDHFLNLLLPVTVAADLERFLRSGGRRAGSWLQKIGYVAAVFQSGQLNSVNSPAQLHADRHNVVE